MIPSCQCVCHPLISSGLDIGSKESELVNTSKYGTVGEELQFSVDKFGLLARKCAALITVTHRIGGGGYTFSVRDLIPLVLRCDIAQLFEC